MVYWTDVRHSTISRAFLDGTGFVVILQNLQAPDGITLDIVNRVMYWTDTGSELIEKATLDGEARSVLLNLTSASRTVEPRAIVLDSTNSHLYWTDWGDSPRIERANLDGSDRRVLVSTNLQWPNGLALDVPGGRMFWCDAGLDLIETSNLLGQNRATVADLTSYAIHPFDIAFYRGDLFWTDWRFLKVVRLTFSPAPEVTLVGSANFQKGGGIHMHIDTFSNHSCVDSKPCGQGERCRQFNNHYECICMDGLAGNDCSLSNPCRPSPCNNGGSCLQSTTNDDGYICRCANRYSGTLCETFDDPCNSDPCKNGATCVGSSDGFTCTCTSEFMGMACDTMKRPYDLVFVANVEPPGIFIAPTDTFNFTLIPGSDNHTHIRRPVAIDYDPVDGMIYWTDIELSTISRMFLDGTGLEILIEGVQVPEGLVLDQVNRIMYWTDSGSNLIERATFNGRNRSVIHDLTDASRSEINPRSIVLDPQNGYLYWTDWGTNPRIERSRIDGSDRRILVNTSLEHPNGLILEGDRLFWCDASYDRVEFADLLGRGRTIIADLTAHDVHPYDVAYHYGFIYWTDWRSQSIIRVDVPPTTITNYGSNSFQRATGIHIYQDTGTDHSCRDSSPCASGDRCRQFATSYECVVYQPPQFVNGCPDNIFTKSDTQTSSVSVSWSEPSVTGSSLPLGLRSTHASGDMFTVGDTTVVIYTVTDSRGKSATCNFTVAVSGVGLDCPGSLTLYVPVGFTTATASWTLPRVVFTGPPLSVTYYVGQPTTPTPSRDNGQVLVYSDYHSMGNTFNIGVTPVIYWVQGLTTQCRFDVRVLTYQPPQFIGCPNNISAKSDTQTSSVSVSWSEPSVTGSSLPLDLRSTHSSGDMFTVGDTTVVIYTVTDSRGKSAACNFTVAVSGVGLDCPGSLTLDVPLGSARATVSWTLPRVVFTGPPLDVTYYVGQPPTPTTSDDNRQVLVYSEYQSTGDTFDIGVTPVIYRVQGLATQCRFDVRIVDNERPEISNCPGDVTLPVLSSTDHASHKWTEPTITDNSGSYHVDFHCLAADPALQCRQNGSGMFAVGITKISYNATDGSRNLKTCTFTVTVKVVGIKCDDLTIYATPGFTNTSVNWPEPDLIGWNGPTNFTSTSVPGDVFFIGSHKISYTQWFGALRLDCTFYVYVVGRCAETSVGDLSWKATLAGTTAGSMEVCSIDTKNAGQPLALRNCSVVEAPVYFQWEEPQPQSCGTATTDLSYDRVADIPVSEGNAAEIAKFLVNKTSESTDEDAGNVEAVSEIIENIVDAESGDKEVTQLVVQTVNNIITNVDTAPGVSTPNAASSSSIVKSVETQVSLTLQEGNSVSIQQDKLQVEAVSLDVDRASSGLTFASVVQSSSQLGEGSLAGTDVKTFTNASVVPQDIVASVRLPANINKLLESQNGNMSTKLEVSFIVYADDTLFQSALVNQSSLQVAGSVVSLSVENIELVNLSQPVVIEFRAPSPTNPDEEITSIKCAFWDFNQNDKVGDWSYEGCTLAVNTSAVVSCNCSHATNFAILVDIHGKQYEALDLISQIGCGLSIIGLVSTLIIYLSFRKLRTGKSRQIFINFCVSLLMLYIVFLAGIDSGQGSGGGCVFVAALLHYLVLASMMWMAVIARNLYVSTVKVFPEDDTWYIVKACVIAWGSPLILVIITLAAATDHYGNKEYCFLQVDLVLYLAVLVPIGLILIHNIVSFVLIMRSLLKVKEVTRSAQISKRLQNAIGICTLMGLTWILGFLAMSNKLVFVFQLLFCLTNSMQGLTVFILFCVRPEEVRTMLAPYMKRICCCHPCTVPSCPGDRRYDLSPLSETGPTSPTSLQTSHYEMSMSGTVSEVGTFTQNAH